VSGLTLRRVGPADGEFAYRVKKAALRGYVEKVWGWNEEEQRQLHERRFAAQEFRIIALDGSDVGVVATVETADALRVNQLLVLPEHQGRGIGTECMRLLLEQARRRGLSVRLQVMKVNPRAVAFYERLGFARTGETGAHHLLERGSENGHGGRSGPTLAE
jgi:ribosomal protein S18 acetylase RimI-like enzyme